MKMLLCLSELKWNCSGQISSVIMRFGGVWIEKSLEKPRKKVNINMRYIHDMLHSYISLFNDVKIPAF